MSKEFVTLLVTFEVDGEDDCLDELISECELLPNVVEVDWHHTKGEKIGNVQQVAFNERYLE